MTAAGLETAAVAITAGMMTPLEVACSGLSVQLEAHPWWARSSARIGALIGVALALALCGIQLHRAVVLAMGVLIASTGAWAAQAGKLAFSNSYAEDALAGRFCYWGWIGGLACLTLLVATVFLPPRSRSPLLARILVRA